MGFESADYSNSLRMPTEWDRKSLGELLSAIIDYRGKTPPKSPRGIPCLTAANVRNGRIALDGVSYISEETYSKVTTRGHPQQGDVLMTTEAPVGEVAGFPGDRIYHITRRLVALRAKPERLDGRFLIYFLQSPQIKELLRSRIRGSTVERILKEDITRLPIGVPPLAEQHAIAHILGTLDDKIELNRRMNQTLEEMARALFKSWFVDFDPVRAKAEGREPVGMDAETAALFTDSFEDSKVGPIPRGWEVEKLGDVTSVLRRGLQPKYIDSDGVLILNQRCIRDGRVLLEKARRHDSDKRSIEGREVGRLDVLINSTGVGTLGRISIMPALCEITVVDSHVTVVRADVNKILPLVLGVDLRMREQDVELLGEGSTGQTELSRKRLAQLPVVVPSRAIQERFQSYVEPQFKRAELNDRTSETLTRIRDSLLPKLLSGELRIDAPEKFLEERLS